MLFSQLQFIFYFLPVVLLGYFIAPKALRNTVLVIASLVFYTWGGSRFVPVLVASIFVNYLCGVSVSVARERNSTIAARVSLAAGIALNLGLLGYFKYANFFVAQLQLVLKPSWSETWTSVLLPIGISFYTFHSMSYIIDVYRGTSRIFRNPIDYALYVTFFPQLIAGPIARFHQISGAIRDRTTNLQFVGEGAIRFTYGLSKKVFIADPIGNIANAAFTTPPSHLNMSLAWLGAIAYTFQLYFDFSGYSDMAIGLARIFGFHLPENFLRPYSALSITDFWRRWHMTLSAWFRDYLFIPLGGSRTSPSRTYFNLALVFLLVGLWHGANWTFVVWGIYHGSWLIFERLIGMRIFAPDRFRLLRQIWTFLIVVAGWVIFRSDSLSYAFSYLHALVDLHPVVMPASIEAALDHRNIAALLIASATLAINPTFSTGRWLVEGNERVVNAVRIALLMIVFPATLVAVVTTDFSPFLYFHF